jgi:succinoglycan biosynthesis protein ExoM
MVSCREAIVSETVEEHRLNSDYLLRKAVRVGETYFRIFFAGASRVARSALLTRAGLQWFTATAIALCLRPLSRGDAMRFRIKAAANLGKLRAAFGCDSVRLYGG